MKSEKYILSPETEPEWENFHFYHSLLNPLLPIGCILFLSALQLCGHHARCETSRQIFSLPQNCITITLGLHSGRMFVQCLSDLASNIYVEEGSPQHVMSLHNQTTDIIEGNQNYVYKALNAELLCSRHIKIYHLLIDISYVDKT